MTDTENFLLECRRPGSVRDTRGRTIVVRALSALDKLRLLKAAGPDLSQNEAWLNVAALAASVLEIDGVPRAAPASERQIETLIAELDDVGLDAISAFLAKSGPDTHEPTDKSQGNA